jgi:hypothetical protein
MMDLDDDDTVREQPSRGRGRRGRGSRARARGKSTRTRQAKSSTRPVRSTRAATSVVDSKSGILDMSDEVSFMLAIGGKE